jgi:hypothetical protein
MLEDLKENGEAESSQESFQSAATRIDFAKQVPSCRCLYLWLNAKLDDCILGSLQSNHSSQQTGRMASQGWYCTLNRDMAYACA